MTQPAISHAITELEEETGNILFDRISRRIYLNETGKLLYHKVVHMLEEFENFEADFCNLEKQAVIRIGSSITIANFWLPAIFKKFDEKSDGRKLKLIIDTAKKISDKLNQNEIDLALIEGVIHYHEFIKIPFSSYCLHVFCAPSHPFVIKKEITIEELCEETLLLREKGSAIRDVLDSSLLLHNISLEPAWVSINSQALIQGVKQNLGVTVLPDRLVEREEALGELVRIHVTDLKLRNENHVVYHKDKYLSDPLKRLIQIVEEFNIP